MSITSFRLAREAQELKEKEEVVAPAKQEACPMPEKTEKTVEPEPKAVEKVAPAPVASSAPATMKPKTKTTTQK